MSNKFSFKHEFVDKEGGYDGWGAALAQDFDNDGRVEYATGGKGGGFYHIYDYNVDDDCWQKHVITNEFSPNVGAAVSDFDKDGRLEIICGEWGKGLWYLVPPRSGLSNWSVHKVWEGISNAHDVLAADLTGTGKNNIIVREKDGPLRIFYVPENPLMTWREQTICPFVAGDGSAVADISNNGALDIVTSGGIFYNVNSDGTEWERQPLIPTELNWHPETRLAVGDVDGDGVLEVVITESEIGNARIAVLKRGQLGKAWDAEIIVPAYLDRRAFHSLNLIDIDNDGQLEILTGEMENSKSDGVIYKPRWWCYDLEDGEWKHHPIVDMNLGTHAAITGNYKGNGNIGMVGKVWRANKVNGNDGKNHVDYIELLKIFK